jgi:transposase
MHENLLRKWVREQPEEAFPGNGKTTIQGAKIAGLRREVDKFQMGRDLLKEAEPYFANVISEA